MVLSLFKPMKLCCINFDNEELYIETYRNYIQSTSNNFGQCTILYVA